MASWSSFLCLHHLVVKTAELSLSADKFIGGFRISFKVQKVSKSASAINSAGLSQDLLVDASPLVNQRWMEKGILLCYGSLSNKVFLLDYWLVGHTLTPSKATILASKALSPRHSFSTKITIFTDNTTEHGFFIFHSKSSQLPLATKMLVLRPAHPWSHRFP